MAKNSKLDHIYDNIEDYFEGDSLDEEMGYLDFESDDDFKDFLDHRATRKSGRKNRGKRGGRGEHSHRKFPDEWGDLQYG